MDVGVRCPQTENGWLGAFAHISKGNDCGYSENLPTQSFVTITAKK
jgi:hypothetical protein